jgi:glycosyltransferase involved in cell wall biosynthesis
LALIGRLDNRKGHDVLFKAMSVLRSHHSLLLHAAIVGSGSHQHVLEEMARALGLAASVRFLGDLPDPWSAVSDAEVLVVPSLNEGVPLVILEGLARRKVIVASDVGAVQEVVQHNVNGFLVPSGDPVSLAQTLRHVFTVASASLVQMRDAAHRAYTDRYTIAASCDALQRAILATEKETA